MELQGLIVGASSAANNTAVLLRESFPTWIIHHASNFTRAQEILHKESPSYLAFILLCLSEGDVADEIMMPLLVGRQFTRSIVLTGEKNLTGAQNLIDQGRLDLVMFEDISDERLRSDMENQVNRYCQRANLPMFEEDERESFVFALPGSDDEIMDMIVAGVDECLGYQPRIVLPPGVRITREGTIAEEAMLCLSGQVSLERESHAGNVLMHHASTGRIIGLLSLTDQRTSFFTSRTTTEVTGIRLTFEQLNHVITTRPEIELLIVVLLIRSLDRRLRRAEDIQLEKVELTARLESEQRELQETYRALEEARAELMSQARFATLGELASGIAHEVNNPIAAITRTSDHLHEDIGELMSHLGKGSETAQAALNSALTSAPLSTREARRLKKTYGDMTGDPERASRLILAGVDEGTLSRVPRGRTDLLDIIESSASLGTGLRNLKSASTRINSLVDSLRSYARPDGDPLADIDINVNIDDTLRLLSHRLKTIEISRDYGDIGPITCHPAQLSQVWTNLLTNAADAVTDSGTGALTITTSKLDENWVRVTIEDNGSGIPPELLEHIFEPRFTTKSGRVQFGMGLGLTIAKNIVERHSGRISLDSYPTGTVATVDLPREGP
ncbi:MAG: ATP-binding protein [Flaviflexus sp.]|uniref:sensor histidine kinase n=1 Tax=Flaviflexus sp. TaxID=1969482 RepID=UPI00352C4E6D